MNVVVNGLMTSYQKTGKGKVLVFLPGWGDNIQTYSGLAAKFSGGYQVYLLDLPGFGGTQAPPRAWGLEDYADFLIAWLDKMGLKPLAVIGHSYGGAVAITAASRRKIADRLVLLASAGIRNRQPIRKKTLAAAAKAGKLPLLVLPKSKRNKIRSKFYGSIGSDLMLLPHMEETFRMIINDDVSERARAIRIPTLLIYGTGDRSTPASDGRRLNNLIAGSCLELVEAGHFLHQEKPVQVAGLINRFINGKANDV
jgi:pimeloyl-ACP methyl ester carboxylesterase